MFGFGQKTHIDIPGEKEGILPTMNWLENNKSSGGFQKGKLLNYGIGQGEIQTTPLQMALYTSAIANKGTIHQPHVVRKVYSVLSGKIEDVNFESKDLPVDEKVFNIIHDGMYAVVNEPGGTASNARIPGYDVCGKTGTAQNPHGKPHAWFVSFAPKDDPQIALCVFVENEGYGGAVAAPKAKQVMEAFFRVEKEKEIITEAPAQEQESPVVDSLSTITQNSGTED